MITDLDIAVGLSAATPIGFGIVGPFGDADSIDPGDYKITGWPVNLRAEPGGKVIGSVQGGINEAGVAAPSQDTISTDGKVERRYIAGQTTVPYAHVVKVNNVAREGWVAVRYLAPMSWEPPAGVTPPPAPVPPAAITPAAVTEEKKPTDYTTPILIGAGVVAVGVIGWAVLAPKRRRRRRLARAA